MLNFRKLRRDFSSSILKEGKELYEKNLVVAVKILSLDGDSMRFSSRIRGAYENLYESEIEIDRHESEIVDSNCDCTYTFDCQHIAALLFYLEKHFDKILVDYSQENDLEKCERIDDTLKQQLKETFEEAACKEEARKDERFQKEVLREYIGAVKELSSSPFFLNTEKMQEDKAELGIILSSPKQKQSYFEVQLALRLLGRSKPLLVPNVKAFVEAVYYRDPLYINGKNYFFSSQSFDTVTQEIWSLFINNVCFTEKAEERHLRMARLPLEGLGSMLAHAYDLTTVQRMQHLGDGTVTTLPCFYLDTLEAPLAYSTCQAKVCFSLEYLETPAVTLLLNSTIDVQDKKISLEEGILFESTKPGLVYQNTYYRFPSQVKRLHLKNLFEINDLAIPKPLFGTFIENSLPVLRKYAEVNNLHLIKQFITLPFTETIKGKCLMHYLNGELEVQLFFLYGDIEIPASFSQLTYGNIVAFERKEGRGER